MTSPSYELQDALTDRMKAFVGLTSLVSTRIYDAVPSVATFPYVSWGPEQVIEDDADCITGLSISLQVDAWSRTIGQGEVKKIAEQVRLALHKYEAVLTDNALVLLEHSSTQFLRDPDGRTNHAVIEFSAFVEQP